MASAARLFDRFGLFCSEFRQLRSEVLVRQRKHGDGVKRGIGCACLADGESRHRDAFRHLHGGKQRIETLQMLRGHRHAEHWKGRMRRHHAGEVGGAAGARDDGFQAALRRAFAHSATRSGVRCADIAFAS